MSRAGHSIPARLNWLRAGVLGANDGIVSTAALVLGVAGATAERGSILLAGLVGLLAGALSMAAGEFVSVSTQRDSQRAMLRRQRRLLQIAPDRELAALAAVYVAKGIDERTAFQVAQQLTAHDAVSAHAESRLGVDPGDLTNPWHAALASFVAFTVGALVPIAGVIVGSNAWLTVAFRHGGAVGHRRGQRSVGSCPDRSRGAPQRRRRAAGHGRHVRAGRPGRICRVALPAGGPHGFGGRPREFC